MWKVLILLVPVFLALLTALITEHVFKWAASFQELFIYSLLFWSFWGALSPLIVKIQKSFPWSTTRLPTPFLVNIALCAVASFAAIYWELTVWYLAVDGATIGELFASVTLKGMLISFSIGFIIYLCIAGIANANIYWRKWKTGKSLIADLQGKISDLKDAHYSLHQSQDGSFRYLDRLMVKSNGRAFIIGVDDIQWIEAADYYVALHSNGKTFLLRETMKNLEKKLNPKQFFRTHRSSIVNLQAVKEMKKETGGDYTVLLNTGEALRLVRTRRQQLESMLKVSAGG